MIKKNQNKAQDAKATKWILLALVAMTLYFNSKVQDPFNAPKFWILLVIGGWLFGYAFEYSWKSRNDKFSKNLTLFSAIFIVFLMLNITFAQYRYVAIFGEYQRKNGALSYLFLLILLITAVYTFNQKNIHKFFISSFVVSTVLVVYGNLQASGIDFVKWNNPYNAVIGTLGNPNFSAATMAILGSLAFGYIFIAKQFYLKLVSLLIFISLFYTIYQTEARQGLVSLASGIGFFLSFLIFFINRRFGILSFGVLGASLIASILGMLQIGPLTDYLYKGSVTVRGYYWRAGMKMLQENPLFGIGLDNYGSFFKEYRETSYSLKYGFDITSSAAHNSYIQMFATGGMFLGFMYFALTVFVLVFGIRSLFKLNESSRLIQIALLASFLTYIAQSLVSIDNLGIAVWGWVLMGAIIGIAKYSISQENNKISERPKTIFNFYQLTSSVIVGSIALITSIFLYQGEKNVYQAAGYYNPTASNQRELFFELTKKTLSTPLLDPRHKLTSGMQLVSFGFIQEGMQELEGLVNSNPRNIDALNVLAEFSVQLGKIDDAINYRIRISELDPWNAKNYLALGGLYKQKNDIQNMNAMLDKIRLFASENQIYLDAKNQLTIN
jgi:O-antigen ligase